MTVSTLEATPSAGIAALDSSFVQTSREREPDNVQRSDHLALLDGLRAYLASWVVVCHAMWVSGFECDDLSGVCAVVCRGAHAVDVFVLLSGFVIFKLLDARKETYGVFIVRRFLRLFPVYILLFLLAIPASQIAQNDLALSSRYFTHAHASEVALQFQEWFRNIGWHAVLHLVMLHGVVPHSILPEGPGAFLEPAWSISLEWQFYLIAPLAYALAVSGSATRRVIVNLAALLLFVLATSGALPAVDFGAALPFHAEYFYLGAASYFLYKRNLHTPISESPALVLLIISLFVFQLGHRYPGLIPLCIWGVVLGLSLERGANPWTRWAVKPFVHPIAQYVGRISYSLYLCHMVLLFVLQHVLLRVAPDLSRTAHCAWLVALTFAVSIPASAFLFRYVESVGIRLGQVFAKRNQPATA
ncbi:MAG TPA: acyltransferase [Polyangiales bacterium]|nr:acyltransferase [Polyangiales bacterium]